MKLYFLNGIPEYVKTELLKRPLRARLSEVVEDAKRIENAQKKNKKDGGTNIAATNEEKTEEKEKEKEKKKEKETTVDEKLKKLQEEINAMNQQMRGGRGNGRGGYRGQRGSRGSGYGGFGFRGNTNHGRGNYQNGNRGFYNQNQRRIFCFRCRKWSMHRSATCPVPQDQLNSIQADDPKWTTCSHTRMMFL